MGLVAERSGKRRAGIALPGATRGQYTFSRTGKFLRENFRADLDENRKGLGAFLWKFEQ